MIKKTACKPQDREKKIIEVSSVTDPHKEMPPDSDPGGKKAQIKYRFTR